MRIEEMQKKIEELKARRLVVKDEFVLQSISKVIETYEILLLTLEERLAKINNAKKGSK